MMGLNDKINERVAEALLEVEKHSSIIASGLTQFNRGQRLTGARSLPVTAHGRLWGGLGRVVGWSVYAKGGPVEVLIRDSRVSADGDVIGGFNLVDGEESTQWMGPGGVSFGEGVFLDVQAGALANLRGAVWIGAVD
jgi:hypothetical protein